VIALVLPEEEYDACSLVRLNALDVVVRLEPAVNEEIEEPEDDCGGLDGDVCEVDRGLAVT
jgi:hypothetical protein